MARDPGLPPPPVTSPPPPHSLRRCACAPPPASVRRPQPAFLRCRLPCTPRPKVSRCAAPSKSQQLPRSAANEGDRLPGRITSSPGRLLGPAISGATALNPLTPRRSVLFLAAFYPRASLSQPVKRPFPPNLRFGQSFKASSAPPGSCCFRSVLCCLETAR